MRAAARKQDRNKTIRTLTKTDVKKAAKAISSGDMEAAKTSVKGAISTLDKAAEKKILHKNNVARKKSRLMKKLNKAGKPAETK
jgi:small subunit ribosomal protein S20